MCALVRAGRLAVWLACSACRFWSLVLSPQRPPPASIHCRGWENNWATSTTAEVLREVIS